MIFSKAKKRKSARCRRHDVGGEHLRSKDPRKQSVHTTRNGPRPYGTLRAAHRMACADKRKEQWQRGTCRDSRYGSAPVPGESATLAPSAALLRCSATRLGYGCSHSIRSVAASHPVGSRPSPRYGQRDSRSLSYRVQRTCEDHVSRPAFPEPPVRLRCPRYDEGFPRQCGEVTPIGKSH